MSGHEKRLANLEVAWRRNAEKAETRRHDMLAFIRRFIDEHGYSPSLREIGAGVGVGKSQAQEHLRVLRDEGAVDYVDGVTRTIVVRK